MQVDTQAVFFSHCRHFAELLYFFEIKTYYHLQGKLPSLYFVVQVFKLLFDNLLVCIQFDWPDAMETIRKMPKSCQKLF